MSNKGRGSKAIKKKGSMSDFLKKLRIPYSKKLKETTETPYDPYPKNQPDYLSVTIKEEPISQTEDLTESTIEFSIDESFDPDLIETNTQDQSVIEEEDIIYDITREELRKKSYYELIQYIKSHDHDLATALEDKLILDFGFTVLNK